MPSPDLTREAKIQLLYAHEERERRKRETPFLYYEPASPKHVEFHTNPARRKVMVGGNKSGKTFVGVMHALAHLVGYWFWLVPNLQPDSHTGFLPSRDRVPTEFWIRLQSGRFLPWPNVGNIVTGLAKDEGLTQTIWPILESMIPPKTRAHPDYVLRRGQKGDPTFLHIPGHGDIHFFSGFQDDLSFEATRIQWAWLDEPVKPFIYNGLWRGLAMDMGPIWFTLTPLGARSTWIYSSIVKPKDPDVFSVTVYQSDNPYFSGEARAAFEANRAWTDAERRARLYGEWEAVGNRIIHTWNTRVHVIPATPLPRDWLRGQTVDPHHVRPAAVVWWAKSPWGVYHFYREWPPGEFVKLQSGGLAPDAYATLFREIEGADVPEIRIADPRFAKAEHGAHGTKQTAWAEQMGNAGLTYDTNIRGIGTIEIGEQKIINMLKYNEQYPISPTNTPKILVHDCCTNLIDAMENYGLLMNRDPTKGQDSRASEEYKDFIDAVRYTVLYDIPRFETDETIGEGRLFDPAAERLMHENESW